MCQLFVLPTQSLNEELSSCRDELSVSEERVRGLEMEVEDQQAQVKITEKKSQALVSLNTWPVWSLVEWVWSCAAKGPEAASEADAEERGETARAAEPTQRRTV